MDKIAKWSQVSTSDQQPHNFLCECSSGPEVPAESAPMNQLSRSRVVVVVILSCNYYSVLISLSLMQTHVLYGLSVMRG